MEESKIEVPSGVKADVNGMRVNISGRNGTIERDFEDPRFIGSISLEKGNSEIIIKYDPQKRKVRAMAGTIRAHIGNMLDGVTHGYKYTLRIVYTHFPITVSVEKEKVLIKNFLGERGMRTADIVGGAHVKVEKEFIEVTGANIEEVSQTAANIENACRLTKRDRRIFNDGIYIDRSEVMK